MKISIVEMKSELGKYSLTTEVGDIQDAEYFLKTLNVKNTYTVSDIFNILLERGSSVCLISNVFCFKTEEDAKKAATLIHSLVKQASLDKSINDFSCAI